TLNESLGRGDLLALRLDGEHGAGVDRLVIEEHGAGAAGTAVADPFAAGDVEVIAQRVEQGDARLDLGFELVAVNGEGQGDWSWPHADGIGFLVLGGGLSEGGGAAGDGSGRRSQAGAAQELPARKAGPAIAIRCVAHRWNSSRCNPLHRRTIGET